MPDPKKIQFPKTVNNHVEMYGMLFDILESLQENLNSIAQSLEVISVVAEKYGLQNRIISPDDIYETPSDNAPDNEQ